MTNTLSDSDQGRVRLKSLQPFIAFPFGLAWGILILSLHGLAHLLLNHPAFPGAALTDPTLHTPTQTGELP